MKWIGPANYAELFTDPLFWKSCLNTMIYGFGSTLLQNIFGLLVRVFVNKKFRGRNTLRVVLYMPIMISAFIMGQIIYVFCAV